MQFDISMKCTFNIPKDLIKFCFCDSDKLIPSEESLNEFSAGPKTWKPRTVCGKIIRACPSPFTQDLVRSHHAWPRRVSRGRFGLTCVTVTMYTVPTDEAASPLKPLPSLERLPLNCIGLRYALRASVVDVIWILKTKKRNEKKEKKNCFIISSKRSYCDAPSSDTSGTS